MARANKRHNFKYIYHNDDIFKNRNKDTKLIITCPIHGDFYQLPHNHLQGKGCPKCNQSHLEKEIIDLLEENEIESIDKFKYLY